MRNARAVLLVALTAMALTASAASAAYEVVTESSGIHCSATLTENLAPATPEVAGGCPVRGTGNDMELGGAFGAMVVCDVTIEGKVSESGAAITSSKTFNQCESGSATPCTAAGDRHPTATPTSASGFPATFTMTFCTNAFGLTIRCTGLSGTLNELAGHNYSSTLVHTNKCANGTTSLAGTVTAVIDAAHPRIEVR